MNTMIHKYRMTYFGMSVWFECCGLARWRVLEFLVNLWMLQYGMMACFRIIAWPLDAAIWWVGVCVARARRLHSSPTRESSRGSLVSLYSCVVPGGNGWFWWLRSFIVGCGYTPLSGFHSQTSSVFLFVWKCPTEQSTRRPPTIHLKIVAMSFFC